MVSIDNRAYELYPKCGFRVSLDLDGFRFTVGDLLCTSFPALHSRCSSTIAGRRAFIAA